MAITYTWNVNTMDAAPSEDGLTDVVKVIHWRLTATDGTYTADAYSTVSLGAPDPAHFTNFNDLTEAEVISWVESKLDVDAVKAGLVNQLANLANPPIVTLQGPWTSANTANT
jgi:hypothetical protein